MTIDKFIVAEIKALYQSVSTGAITFSRMVEILNERMSKEVDAAIGRAVEEETATLRAELERLKQCEAIVREIAGSKWITDQTIIDSRIKARQWVKDNPPHTGR